MFDDKTQRDMLVQIGATAAAAAAAAVSLAKPVSARRAAVASQGDTVNPRAPITVNAAGPLRDKQMLQVRLVSDANGLRVASSKVADLAEELPTIGVSADRTALDVAVIREGDALRIYGLNGFAYQSDESRCIIF